MPAIVAMTVALCGPASADRRDMPTRDAGIDLLWFGIYIVLVDEMSQVTPPVRFNLFGLHGLTRRNIL